MFFVILSFLRWKLINNCEKYFHTLEIVIILLLWIHFWINFLRWIELSTLLKSTVLQLRGSGFLILPIFFSEPKCVENGPARAKPSFLFLKFGWLWGSILSNRTLYILEAVIDKLIPLYSLLYLNSSFTGKGTILLLSQIPASMLTSKSSFIRASVFNTLIDIMLSLGIFSVLQDLIQLWSSFFL